MSQPKVSIIISTFNRSANLRRALESLSYLRYRNFEVIVVNGPSTDDTASVVADFERDILLLSTAETNLSLSRNIGAANSTGQFLAFMDDDAIPEPDWLDRLVGAFDDPNIAAVGGYIRDNSGVHFQAKVVVCDLFGQGESFSNIEMAHFVCQSNADRFISLTGTNTAVRRSDIELIGGFDETFEYFLDETDLNIRLVKLGKKLSVIESAEIHHKYAESHLRTGTNIPKRMLPITRSVAYFVVRHALPVYGWNAVLSYLKNFELSELAYKSGNHAAGQIDGPTFDRLAQEIRVGIRDGIARGVANQPETWEAKVHRFGKGVAAPQFKTLLPTEKRLRLCMLSQDEGGATLGGIGRWTRLVAQGLAARGHEVTVMGRNEKPVHTVDFTEAGYWSHRLPDDSQSSVPDIEALGLPSDVSRHSRRMRAEFDRALPRRQFNVASTPIWDVEGGAMLADERLRAVMPVCLSLHTTAAIALDFKPEWRANAGYMRNHVQRIILAETLAMRKAAHLIANSKAIIRDIEDRYRIHVEPSRVTIVPHGIEDVPPVLRGLDRAPSDVIRILFVGRLERRKGADILAEVAEALCAKRANLCIDFVGAGAEKDVIARVQAAQARFPTQLQHHGYVSEAELTSFYAGANIFVAPSRYESFGLIFAEAMRFSLPCVGFHAGGVPEVVEHGETGILTKVDDAKALFEALDSLCENSDRARQMGVAGRRRYETDFTVDVMSQRLEDVYHHAIASVMASHAA